MSSAGYFSIAGYRGDEVIDPDNITVPERLREVDPIEVEKLVASFHRLGLLQPITVREIGPLLANGYVLLSGAHRLAAWRIWRQRTGRTEWIRAVVLPQGWVLFDQLIEIDENLCRNDLTTEQLKAAEAAARKPEEPAQQPAEPSPARTRFRQRAVQPAPWFEKWYLRTKLPRQSAYDLWHRFLASRDGPRPTPDEVGKNAPLVGEFIAYVEQNPTKSVATKAARAAPRPNTVRIAPRQAPVEPEEELTREQERLLREVRSALRTALRLCPRPAVEQTIRKVLAERP
jgi:hypothetical protein